MTGGTEFDNGKFKELILLMTERSAEDPKISRVKLNKLLYLADFGAFRKLGRSITGATYVKGEFGPMAYQLPRAEEELGNRGALSYRTDDSGPKPRKVPIAHESADQSLFAEEELQIIDAALAELAAYGGSGASDWSHDDSAGWELVEKEGDAIPYETAFISKKRPTRAMHEHAARLAKERGWDKVRP